MIKEQEDTADLREGIIGESPQIRKVIATARKLASSSSITTLIIGESGTGKELFAQLIARYSDSSSRPFVDINCGAIPENLLESELFGYEKGAFTGAHMRKQGLFELADGGTIFLDEIANTTINFQVKLLKAVESKKFRRLSGVEEVTISTRIIAATNIDLREAVNDEKFREDLYYRLNVCQINIPPLRERGNDVLILARHFINTFNQEYDRHVNGLADSAVRLFKEYPWPGNVRQLKNAIERAVLVESEDWIEADHISLDSGWTRQSPVVVEEQETPRVVSDFSNFVFPEEGIALEELERTFIVRALDQAQGNISRAARLLKINRGKLRYRMERLGLTPQQTNEMKFS